MRLRNLSLSLVGWCFLLAGIGALFSNLHVAVADEGQADVRKLRESGEILPLERIAELARVVRPGIILEAELEKEGDSYIYELEILDAEGRVWEVKLDATTGDVIEVEAEDEDEDETETEMEDETRQ